MIRNEGRFLRSGPAGRPGRTRSSAGFTRSRDGPEGTQADKGRSTAVAHFIMPIDASENAPMTERHLHVRSSSCPSFAS